MHNQLTPTDYLLSGLIAICLAVIVVYIMYRIATGHLRDDFMTPREVRDYYLRDIPPSRMQERLRSNPRWEQKSLAVFCIGLALMSIMVFVFNSLFH